MNKCFVARTKDKRIFPIKENTLGNLKEFAKTFSVKFYSAKVKTSPKLLGLDELADAFCNSDYKFDCAYEIIEEVKLGNRSRNQLLEQAISIRGFIEKELRSGNTVSLNSLSSKFNGMNLTTSCLCNHLTFVRNQLIKSGVRVSKIKCSYKIDK